MREYLHFLSFNTPKAEPARAVRMTSSLVVAPELKVQCWFNTDFPPALSNLRERVVVLVAFQVLCPKSIATAVPQAQRIFDLFSPNDVAVIGLHSTFEHPEAYNSATLKSFIQEYRLKFPIGQDLTSSTGPIPQTMEHYKMRGTPSLVLIDRKGLIRKHAFGPVEDLRLGAEIGALTQQAAILVRSSAA